METYAIHKNAMVAPRKCRMTIDLIRGKKVTDAANILKNTNTKSARLIEKVLNSAVANATNNYNAKIEDLVVSECFANPGVVLLMSFSTIDIPSGSPTFSKTSLASG